MFHTAMAVTAPKVAGVATGTFAVLYLLFFITPPSPWRWLLLAPTVAFASFLWTVSLLSALVRFLDRPHSPMGSSAFPPYARRFASQFYLAQRWPALSSCAA